MKMQNTNTMSESECKSFEIEYDLLLSKYSSIPLYKKGDLSKRIGEVVLNKKSDSLRTFKVYWDFNNPIIDNNDDIFFVIDQSSRGISQFVKFNKSHVCFYFNI
jgi:hypothetical protein